ncbi:MAG: hypothetical protein ACD_78C00010G0004 [uncultured bacterium (gcode 4)]|uniref:Uncharacterized protein n=1 Tax=uncultured bacterium (gcode 4) TaxID=1234023 RepID=K1YE66_9BACT|nr:MAG: hypothetical protein ACD_78C00010G0004 [uncultured bacterium (gcode 4)]
MSTNMEATISGFSHLIKKCAEAWDISRLQQIELNTQEMISNGLNRETWEQYLRKVRAAQGLIVEDLLWTNSFVRGSKDN